MSDSKRPGKEIAELEVKIELLEANVTKLTAEAARLHQQIDQQAANLTAKDAQLNKLASDHSEVLEKLAGAGELIRTLKAKLDALTSPPNTYANCVRINEDGSFDIMSSGRRMRVNIDPDLDKTKIKIGTRVVLNDSFAIVRIDPETENMGDEGKVLSLLSERIVRIRTRLDETVDLLVSDRMVDQLTEGDDVLIFNNIVHGKLPKSKEVEHLFLAEVPQETYEDVGGLGHVIDKVIQLIEWPYIYRDAFKERGLKSPKGILLYGPPGCGKTLLAKAVANSLGKKVAELHGKEHSQSYFLCVKGPELLNKWVGETERFIREVFKRARELASQNLPVIIFFDEMDALFRTRGSGISSDIESTIVPQFTTEMDGVETIENIIVIGATNRQDRIDPAVVRPGRFDDKLEIPRPDRDQAKQIFDIYLTRTPDLPLHPQYFDPANYDGDFYIPKDRNGKPRINAQGKIVKYPLKRDRGLIIDYLIKQALDRIFDASKEENQLVELTYANGQKEKLCFSEFISGAVIQAIVAKAIRLELKGFIDSDQKIKGLSKVHLLEAVEEEFAGQEKLPNIADPTEWASLFGKRGRVVDIKDLHEARRLKQLEKVRPIEEKKSLGQYL